MAGVLIVCMALGVWQDPTPPSGAPAEAPAAKAARQAEPPGGSIQKYERMKLRTPDNAAAQWSLALWCEQNGLPAEAYKHFSNVVKLDPKREAAWKKLGFKKFDGQWMTDEQIAQEKEWRKADQLWVPRLKKIHADLHGANGTKKEDEAQTTLDAITDPGAVSSLYREFSSSGPDQLILVNALGQIDKPVASQVLAVLTIYGKTPEVRRAATEIVRLRNPADYQDALIQLLQDPIPYEVKPVGGPGSPGVLLIEGERVNLRRIYAAPTGPNIRPMFGDMITYDEFGMPVIVRNLGGVSTKAGVPGSKTLAYESSMAVAFSARQGILESQRAAAASQAQLQADVAQIEDLNAARKTFNDVVINVLKTTTGKDHGKTPKEWREKLVAADKYEKTRKPARPTIDQVAPLLYRPSYGQIGFMTRIIYDT